MIRINNKVGRALAALVLAFSPFLWSLPASSSDSVQAAELSLATARAEAAIAQAAKDSADISVSAATVERDLAQADVNAAQLSYDNSNVEISRHTSNGLTARSFNTFGTCLLYTSDAADE